MRLIKMFGLAAIAAVAAMAFIGASSASATQSTGLCNENSAELACPSGQLTSSIHAVATNPLLHTDIADVLCSSSLASATILALGKPQIGHLTALTWTGCHRHSGQSCTVVTKLLGLLNILKLSTSDAHATGGANPTVVEVECGFFIDCAYGSTSATTLLGLGASLPSTAGTLHASTDVTENAAHSDGICPNTSTWLALYESLSDVWIRS